MKASKDNRTNLIDDKIMSSLFYDSLSCKKDCNFDRFIKIKNGNSNFSKLASEEDSDWKKLIFSKMNKKVQPMCRKSLKLTAPEKAADLAKDLDSISLLNPTKLGNFSKADTLDIAKALNTGSKKIDKELAKSLGKNIPKDTDVKDVLSIASAIPLECFNNTKATDLVSNLDKMDTENMDNFRKAFIANKVRFFKLNINFLFIYTTFFIRLQNPMIKMLSKTF